MTEVVEAIRDMENRLADLKKMIQSSEGKKKRRERDPNAPKREANDWIKFTQKVEAALKSEGLMFKRVAESKKFAASLKSKKAYAEWTEKEIIAARKTWEETVPAAVPAAAPAASATGTLPPQDDDDDEDVVVAPKKRGRKPMTDEQKAAAKAAREAKKE